MCKLRIGGISRANCSVFRVVQCVSSVAVCCECCRVLQLRIGGMSRANCSVFRVLQCVASIAVCCS